MADPPAFQTTFGSLRRYEHGAIEVIDDDPRNYAFSNVFEVASHSAPYEKIVVGKNLDYVIEVLRAEGVSAWFTAGHDEFALAMDGCIEIELVKLDAVSAEAATGTQGSVKLARDPTGSRMGAIRLNRGHQALLPRAAAYRFVAIGGAGVLILQTMLGPHSIEKWAEICLT
jgi:hypothetical protein